MKTYVIAATTYLEIVRRPIFWLLVVSAAILHWLFTVIPYYTLGEDIKMVKDQGLIVIMIAGLVIALFSASVSIAEEIEGKTAITLLSKPIDRRAFIMGKYFGIMAAIGLLFLILAVNFGLALYYKAGYDSKEYIQETPRFLERLEMIWRMAPGLVLSYFQVSIICALSVAFSTRFPVYLNITACIAIYMLGHIAPQMVAASKEGQFEGVKFMAQIFATVLPGLEYFNVGPAISTDAIVPWSTYVLPCLAYCAMYTAVALCLALLMFEDRDLA